MSILTYQKAGSVSLSPHFKASEFACHGKGCCDTVKIDSKLVEYLEKIREHFDKPVTISSGYRCEVHNKSVNGATASRHLKGMAADIKVEGVKPAEVAKYAESIGILGIGLYETNSDGHFVHIDTRTTKAFWYGQKQLYRSTFGGSAPVTSKPEVSNPKDSELVEFVKEVQKVCGAKVDGIAGPETLSKTVTLSAHKNRTHALVKIVQKRLKDLGYAEIGTVDGVAGPKFTSAVAHFQQDIDLPKPDGEITAAKTTWKKLLGMA